MILIPFLLLLTLTGDDTRCAAISVTATPTAHAGAPVSLRIPVTNCGTKPTRFEIETEIVSACGELFDLPDGYLRLRPGFAEGANTTWYVPLDACPGIYHVEVEVLVGRTVVATGEAEFEVVE